MSKEQNLPLRQSVARRDVLRLTAGGALWILTPAMTSPSWARAVKLPPLVGSGHLGLKEFIRLSQVLTSYTTLDAEMGERMYKIFLEESYGPEHLVRVYEKLRKILEADPNTNRETLLSRDRFDSGELWFIGHLLVTWYTGIYYHQSGNQMVGFSGALMHRALADIRQPATHCSGKSGFWARPPQLKAPIG